MSVKQIGTLTAAEMLAEIDAAEAPTPARDNEWKTTQEWAEFLGCARTTASFKIASAMRKGLMQSRTEYMVSPVRGRHPVPVYKWTGKTSQPPPDPKSAKHSRA